MGRLLCRKHHQVIFFVRLIVQRVLRLIANGALAILEIMFFVSASRLTAMPACGKLGASGRKIYMCFFFAFCFIASCASSRRLASSCCKVMPQGLSLLDATISANFRTVTRCGSKMMRIISCRIYLIAVNALTLLFNACRFRFNMPQFFAAFFRPLTPLTYRFVSACGRQKEMFQHSYLFHILSVAPRICTGVLSLSLNTATRKLNPLTFIPIVGISYCKHTTASQQLPSKVL